MPAPSMNRLRAALALAVVTLSCTAAAQDTTGGIRYGAAPALDCKQISKVASKGSWVEANGVATGFGATRTARLSFSDPVATDKFHATMNGAGARELALVEVQDTKGDWHKAWEGKLSPPAPGFEQTCFESPLPRKQVVQGLRFSFRMAPGQVELNHAALLRR